MTGIDIQLRGSGVNSISIENIMISGGNDVGSINLSGSVETYEKTGDLAFWGLTEQEAFEFLNGARSLTFNAFNDEAVASATANVQTVLCRVEYVSLLTPPVML